MTSDIQITLSEYQKDRYIDVWAILPKKVVHWDGKTKKGKLVAQLPPGYQYYSHLVTEYTNNSPDKNGYEDELVEFDRVVVRWWVKPDGQLLDQTRSWLGIRLKLTGEKSEYFEADKKRKKHLDEASKSASKKDLGVVLPENE